MAQIALINVSNREEYFPKKREYFNDARWTEAKQMLALVLQQTCSEVKYRSRKWLMDRMVAGDFPAVPEGYHNGITCIANGGEHSKERGEFTALDFDGSSYLYEAENGEWCIAQIPHDDGLPTYYRIHVFSY